MSRFDQLFLAWLGAMLQGRRPEQVPADETGELSVEGAEAVRRALAGACVRFLLLGGGVLGGPAYVDGERRRDHRFWEGAIHLRFGAGLYDLLRELCCSRPGRVAAGSLTAADELAVLVIVQEGSPAPGVPRLPELLPGTRLPALYSFWHPHGSVGARGWDAGDATLVEILFALRPMLLDAYLLSEDLLLESSSLPDILSLAHRRQAALEAYVGLASRSERWDLLRPLCDGLQVVFRPGHADAVVEHLSGLGPLARPSARPAAFREVLCGYEHVSALDALRERARAMFWDDVDPGAIGALRSALGRAGEQAWAEAGRLLAALRCEL